MQTYAHCTRTHIVCAMHDVQCTYAHMHIYIEIDRDGEIESEEHWKHFAQDIVCMEHYNFMVNWFYFYSFSPFLHPLNLFQFSWFRFTWARHVARMDCVKIVGSHAQKILNCKMNESKEMYNFQSAPLCF